MSDKELEGLLESDVEDIVTQVEKCLSQNTSQMPVTEESLSTRCPQQYDFKRTHGFPASRLNSQYSYSQLYFENQRLQHHVDTLLSIINHLLNKNNVNIHPKRRAKRRRKNPINPPDNQHV